jgi:hypothetical protein
MREQVPETQGELTAVRAQLGNWGQAQTPNTGQFSWEGKRKNILILEHYSDKLSSYWVKKIL